MQSDAPSLTTTVFSDSDVMYIAVMGPTGTGKTTFLNLLTGSELQVGNDLESCTDSVQISKPFELDEQKIALIDTPGFDDTKLSDTEVLNMIAAYMSFSHDRGRRLAGIIYTHRILDNRMGGISARNFRMFRKLCGEQSLRNVVIVTTMWDDVDQHVGDLREKELMTKDVFFKPAIEKGARIARHMNTLQSAESIIRMVTGSGASSVTLQIQEELGSGMDISETMAGKELGRELSEQMSRHRQEMRGLMEDLQEAIRTQDEESRRELIQERSRTEEMLNRLQADATNMANGYREALRRLEERLKAAEAAAGRTSGGHGMAGRRNAESEYPGQDAQSPVVQAVAATENSNAVLEGKLAAAIPIIGFWGKLAVMLAPFSLSWK